MIHLQYIFVAYPNLERNEREDNNAAPSRILVPFEKKHEANGSKYKR